MSRIGKKDITLPQGVEVTVSGDFVTVKGSRGTLVQKVTTRVTVTSEGGIVAVRLTRENDTDSAALWGLTRALIQNMVTGVSTGFSKSLEINGVGFKAVLQGKKLVLNVGFSHPVEFPLPDGIEATVEKNVITISGNDKQQVGQVSAEIRAVKKPEPYKGKGIKYTDEIIRRKVGKVMKSAA